jgi:hypothetical protein
LPVMSSSEFRSPGAASVFRAGTHNDVGW